MLVWMDLEMTGLDPATDVIVEIATIVTDDQLDIVAEGPDLVIHQPDEALATMDPVVTEMHTRSGLLEAIRGVRRLARRRRRGDARLHPHPCPRAAVGPAVRELDRHRPPLPRRLPARDRGAPALPVDRRVERQGAGPAVVPEARPGPPAEGRPAPGARRHPGVDRGAALLPRAGLRAARADERPAAGAGRPESPDVRAVVLDGYGGPEVMQRRRRRRSRPGSRRDPRRRPPRRGQPRRRAATHGPLPEPDPGDARDPRPRVRRGRRRRSAPGSPSGRRATRSWASRPAAATPSSSSPTAGSPSRCRPASLSPTRPPSPRCSSPRGTRSSSRAG